MKLFYFSGSTLPSGYANAVHVMKMCAAFARAGTDVTLFAKGRRHENLHALYDVPKNFTLRLAPPVKIPLLSGLMRAGFTLWQSRGGKPDFIYGRDLWTIAAMAGSQAPMALELHEIPRTGGVAERLLRHILKARNLRGVVVISESLKADLLRFSAFPAARILVAHDGSDMPDKPVQPRELTDIPGTSFQIGYGGSLYKGKGVELIAQIAALCPDTGFHIIGGPEAERQKWEAQNPPANIRFYGHKPHAELKRYLAACDALIAPYMPHIHINTGTDIARWISPLKLFEYMALQKPILCSDLPVLREVMEEGRNGLLADPLAPSAWAANIARLRGEKSLGHNLAAAAFDDLRTRYNWDIRTRDILSFLRPLS